MTQVTEAFPNLPSGGYAVADSLPRHNRELTLRRYLLLQDEHEFIRRHLDELSATPTTTGTSTSPAPSAAPKGGHARSDSAARRASMPQYEAPRPRFHRRGGGIVGGVARGVGRAETMLDAATLSEMASEEAKLVTVNEGIKRALTELLNCEAARSDRAFRSFCMTRLMETEQELRSGRRRRSCPTE